MSEINYWRIPYTQLPSFGERYPHGSSIKFRCMTVNDLKYMASLKDENADEMVTDILERCLKLDGVRFDQLLRMDRLTMLFFIRTNTFLLSNGFQTEFDCPHCGSRERQEFKMSDLKVKKITESTIHDVDMVDELGICVSGEYKTFADRVYHSPDPLIDLILNNTDLTRWQDMTVEQWTDWIYNLPADKVAKLKRAANDARCGVLGYVDLKCSKCRKVLRVGVDISDKSLFNKAKLSVLIRNKIQISKYCGVQITDDTPYNEVELTIAIVNELSEAEARSLKESKNGAKK